MTRERMAVYAAVVVIVVFRSALFTFTTLSFDADQAMFGLMGKHLVEGRAFPVFMYGQHYILGVEAWMAAPMFLLFGVSVAALKLPLLAVNLAVALLVVWLLERECGLRPRHALLASLFFVLAPPGTVGTLVEASGGNVEPFLYILLLWITRHRPGWFGFIASFGFIHREFTIYGVGVILAMAVMDGAWRRRESWRAFGAGLRVAAETWVVVYLLRLVSSAMGPGTSGVIPGAPSSQLIEAFNRFCFDASTIASGIKTLVTVHWSRLFGTEVLPLNSFGLESAVFQGMRWSGTVLGIGALLITAVAVTHVRFNANWRRRYGFAIYLGAVGGISAAMYVLARCGTEGPLRYDVLSLFGAIALMALFLALEHRRSLRMAGVAIVIGWAALSVVGHARVWAEYVLHPPVPAKELIIRHLDARGITYASSDYWIAYHVAFLTSERIIVASEDVVRIQEYQDIVAAHRSEAIRISRRPCGGERPVIPGVYFCPIEF